MFHLLVCVVLVRSSFHKNGVNELDTLLTQNWGPLSPFSRQFFNSFMSYGEHFFEQSVKSEYISLRIAGQHVVGLVPGFISDKSMRLGC